MMIRSRCFAADLLHTVSACVISDTRCNTGRDKEGFCENITWVNMFQCAIICMCAYQIISVHSCDAA